MCILYQSNSHLDLTQLSTGVRKEGIFWTIGDFQRWSQLSQSLFNSSFANILTTVQRVLIYVLTLRSESEGCEMLCLEIPFHNLLAIMSNVFEAARPPAVRYVW